MNDTIKLDVDADVYRAMEQRAASLGLSMDECLKFFFLPLADKRVVMPGKPYRPSAADRFFGSVASDHPDPLNNELIDADLASEYAGER